MTASPTPLALPPPAGAARRRARRVARRANPNPEHVVPMLAVDCGPELPADGAEWGYEYKWDGMRVICLWDGKRMRLESRNLLDATFKYPELHALGPAIGNTPVVLDGEVVALDAVDRPSFARLQQRMKVSSAQAALQLVREVPVYYFIFDLLYLDGRPLLELPLVERRERLEELTLLGPSWQVSPIHAGRKEGEAMFKAAKAHELEGLVAKRLDSTYEPGRRSPAWRKIKLVMRQEFVVGGWTDEKGAAARGGLGALQLGYYDRSGGRPRLRYAGSVGTGWSRADAGWLMPLLQQRESDTSPFEERIPRKGGTTFHWLRPTLVVEVNYRRWPEGGQVQHASFAGVRFDKKPQEVVKEGRACTAA
jgi:bifunctional non-homologous end joining protein LigD